MQWHDDGDRVWSLRHNGIVIAAYGADNSKPGWYRGFAFDLSTGSATHEAFWDSETETKADILAWFNEDGTLKPFEQRSIKLK